MNRLFQALLAVALLACPGAGHADDGLTYLAHAPAVPAASGHPPLIVLLHGVGADEHDMIGLWHDLPDGLVVISPRAPFRDGGGGWRWYRQGASRASDLEASRKIVDLVVANALQRFDADPARIFIGGFSQGAVMTYEVALHEPGRFRGAAVLSGTLFPSETAALPVGAEKTPFFIAHGTADARIPFGAATMARAELGRLGVTIAFHAYQGMGHTVGAEETRDLSAWLGAQLAKEAGTARQ